MIITITGKPCSGKGASVAKFLEEGGEFKEGLLIILKEELPTLFAQI